MQRRRHRRLQARNHRLRLRLRQRPRSTRTAPTRCRDSEYVKYFCQFGLTASGTCKTPGERAVVRRRRWEPSRLEALRRRVRPRGRSCGRRRGQRTSSGSSSILARLPARRRRCRRPVVARTAASSGRRSAARRIGAAPIELTRAGVPGGQGHLPGKRSSRRCVRRAALAAPVAVPHRRLPGHRLVALTHAAGRDRGRRRLRGGDGSADARSAGHPAWDASIQPRA